MLLNKIKKISLLGIIGAAALVGGCRYDMQDQPRLKAFKESDYFNNRMGSRPLIEGTVPRGFLREDKALYTGKLTNGTSGNTLYPNAVTEFPVPVTPELVARGEERYKVFCTVCHGPFGDGDGMIVRRGYSKPTSYHDPKLVNAPVGHFYDVITNGWGRMSSYASQIPVTDRWAIAAYIRTLQATRPSNNAGAANNGMTNSQTQPPTAPSITSHAAPSGQINAQPNTQFRPQTKTVGGVSR